jgi:hypothetical protein
MSATLGRGGELERITGRSRIVRLAAPEGWDGHGVGRRLFLFPEESLEEGDVESLVAALIRVCGRALLLGPR